MTKPMSCRWCDEGDEPVLLDIDGVLSSVSGTPGCWGHSYEGNWWPCQRKAAEEHALLDQLPKTADDVPVVPGMGMFFESDTGEIVFSTATRFLADGSAILTEYGWRRLECCYSTREAAEKVRDRRENHA